MAYSPCINHGIRKGMGKAQEETNLAVKSGYWPLYRYNPDLKKEGKNPFTLDSKEPDGSLQEFLSGEVRYASLQKAFPDEAKRLHAQLEKEFTSRYMALKRLADQEPFEVSAGAVGGGGEADVCTIADDPEHSRPSDPNAGEACDDGRAGK
jgi:pyruvate-ferredoxin/flavodoxin oxidoreductase